MQDFVHPVYESERKESIERPMSMSEEHTSMASLAVDGRNLAPRRNPQCTEIPTVCKVCSSTLLYPQKVSQCEAPMYWRPMRASIRSKSKVHIFGTQKYGFFLLLLKTALALRKLSPTFSPS